MAAVTDWELTKSEIPNILERRLPARKIAATGAGPKTTGAFQILTQVLARVNVAMRKAGLDPAAITYADATATDYEIVRYIVEIGFAGEVMRAERSGLVEGDATDSFLEDFEEWLDRIQNDPEGVFPDIGGGSSATSGSVRTTVNRLNTTDSGDTNTEADPPFRSNEEW